MCTKGGANVAGLTGLDDQPPAWTSYVLVDDVSASAVQAEQLGGTVVVPVMDVMAAGRMCIIQDPTGAYLALWQAGEHTGADVFNEHGALTWNELLTRDVDGAREFYAQLLGWEYDGMDMPDGSTYHLAKVGGRQIAGIMAIRSDMPEDMPPHWGVYIASDDVDATAKLIQESGGLLWGEAFEMEVGRFIIARDPQGASFTVFKPSGEADA